MTRFDVQKGAVVQDTVPAPTTKQRLSQGFHIGRYEAQLRRQKMRLAEKLLKLAFPGRQLTFTGDNCRVERTAIGDPTYIERYVSTLCDHVPANLWEKLPRSDRYNALHLLIPKEYHTQVPGGMVYQVRFKSKGIAEEWVFLTVGHEIGRCKLVPTALAARVF